MQKTTKYQSATLRFTRWSRSAYAAFCSIGRRVTIGMLSIDIAESSLQKSLGKMVDILFDQNKNENKETETEELAVAQALEVVCPITHSDYHAIGQLYFKNNYTLHVGTILI